MGEDFSYSRIIYYVIFVTFGFIAAGKMWLLFYLIGKKALNPDIYFTKKTYGLLGLSASLYLVSEIIRIDSWQLRTVLIPVSIAIPHAVYFSCFRKKIGCGGLPPEN